MEIGTLIEVSITKNGFNSSPTPWNCNQNTKDFIHEKASENMS